MIKRRLLSLVMLFASASVGKGAEEPRKRLPMTIRRKASAELEKPSESASQIDSLSEENIFNLFFERHLQESMPPTRSPTDAPTSKATLQPSPSPTKQPTPVPTKKPIVVPQPVPSPRPTDAPTRAPKPVPIPVPVADPTNRPTKAPIPSPVATPVGPPKSAPTSAPTQVPVEPPTQPPTNPPVPVPAPQAPPTEPPVSPPVVAIPTRAPVVSSSLRFTLFHFRNGGICSNALVWNCKNTVTHQRPHATSGPCSNEPTFRSTASCSHKVTDGGTHFGLQSRSLFTLSFDTCYLEHSFGFHDYRYGRHPTIPSCRLDHQSRRSVPLSGRPQFNPTLRHGGLLLQCPWRPMAAMQCAIGFVGSRGH
jgi:hypothetical protein